MFFNLNCGMVFLINIVGKEFHYNDTNEVVKNQHLIIVESEEEEESLDDFIDNFFISNFDLGENQLFTIDDLKKAFCLDLQIDENLKVSIFIFMRSVFTQYELFFGSFLLNRCIQTLLDEEKLDELLMNKHVIDEGISLIINGQNNFTDLEVKRLKIIINDIYCYVISESDTTLHFGNIQIDIKANLNSTTEYLKLDDLIMCLKNGLPRMFLSFFVSNHLYIYGQGFNRLLNLHFQENISKENFHINMDLVNKVCGYLNLLDFETFATDFFADYYDMVTKIFNFECKNLELRSDESQTSS